MKTGNRSKKTGQFKEFSLIKKLDWSKNKLKKAFRKKSCQNLSEKQKTARKRIPNTVFSIFFKNLG